MQALKIFEFLKIINGLFKVNNPVKIEISKEEALRIAAIHSTNNCT